MLVPVEPAQINKKTEVGLGLAESLCPDYSFGARGRKYSRLVSLLFSIPQTTGKMSIMRRGEPNISSICSVVSRTRCWYPSMTANDKYCEELIGR